MNPTNPDGVHQVDLDRIRGWFTEPSKTHFVFINTIMNKTVMDVKKTTSQIV